MAAISFGGITTLARLAYDGGTTPATVIDLRFLAAAMVMAAVILWQRKRSFRIPRRDWPAILAMSLGVLGLTAGYLTSITYIPVSLAALIFYTYPLMVAALSPVIEKKSLGLLGGLGFLAAFAGLALALGPTLSDLDWRGVALALFAAVSITTLFAISNRIVVKYDVFTVTFHVNLVCAVIVTGFMVIFGGFTLPTGTVAVISLSGATAFYVLAVTAQFFAIRYSGPARTAMLLNLEPLISIGGAILLLGERLSLVQILGVVLVLIALGLVSARREAPV